jgi:hypothetical protein
VATTIDLTYQVSDNQNFKLDMTSTASVQYFGYCQPGTSDSDPNWKIFILDLDGNGVPVGKRFADGSPAYIHKWSERTNYIYS